MPITKLVKTLSERVRSQRSGSVASRGSESMEASSFEVVAEVVPRSPGSQAGSVCSASSSAVDEREVATSTATSSLAPAPHAGSPGQQQQADAGHIGRSQSDGAAHHLGRTQSMGSSAALLASLSQPLPSLGSRTLQPSASRALRARGKAMVRTESGITCHPSMELPLSLATSTNSSMDVAVAVCLQEASPFLKTASMPLPVLAAGSHKLPLPVGATALAPKPAAAVAAAGGEDDEDLGGEDDDVFVVPAPAADEAASDAHCHWEDGVVASWLLQDACNHTQLLQQGAPAAAAGCSKAAVPAAAPAPAVYSSLLYN